MRRKAFSLLEILVVLFLISSVGVVFSWNLYQRYQKDFFVLQVHKLERWVQLLQNIAAVHGADVICQFSPTEKGWTVKAGFTLACGFSSRKKPQKQNFEKMTFFFKGEETPFELYLTSTGQVFPKGAIRMEYKSFSKEWEVSHWNRFTEISSKEPFFPAA